MAVVNLIDSMLAKDPAKRLPSIPQLLRELDRIKRQRQARTQTLLVASEPEAAAVTSPTTDAAKAPTVRRRPVAEEPPPWWRSAELVKTVVILALVGGVCGHFLFHRPSAETLYREAEQLYARNSRDAALDRAADILKRYPNTQWAEKAEALQKTIKDERRRKLEDKREIVREAMSAATKIAGVDQEELKSEIQRHFGKAGREDSAVGVSAKQLYEGALKKLAEGKTGEALSDLRAVISRFSGTTWAQTAKQKVDELEKK
jgi:TolA-binding protein